MLCGLPFALLSYLVVFKCDREHYYPFASVNDDSAVSWGSFSVWNGMKPPSCFHLRQQNDSS